MADILEVLIGVADPALKMVGSMVEGLQATGKKLVADGIANAMKASDGSVIAAVNRLEAQVAELAKANSAAPAAPRPPVKRVAAKRAAPAKAAAVKRPAARVRPLRAPGR
jgi:hypothetical protein